jgi:hypothetical protein
MDAGRGIGTGVNKALSSAVKVIGLVTFNGMRDPWPIAEMALAHVSEKLIPLAAPYVEFNKLPHVLAGSLALRYTERVDLEKLLSQIGAATGWKLRLNSSVSKAIDAFLAALNSVTSRFPAERLITRKEVMSEEHELKWKQISQRKPQELFLWGWSGVNGFNRQTRDVFHTMATAGTKLNFMVLDPTCITPSMIFSPVCNGKSESMIVNDIKTGINDVELFAKAHPGCIQLRKTKWVMSWSGVAIDPSLPDGLMQVEFYHYNNPKNSDEHLMLRPNLVLGVESPFYEGFWGSLENMWNAAVPVGKRVQKRGPKPLAKSGGARRKK